MKQVSVMVNGRKETYLVADIIGSEGDEIPSGSAIMRHGYGRFWVCPHVIIDQRVNNRCSESVIPASALAVGLVRMLGLFNRSLESDITHYDACTMEDYIETFAEVVAADIVDNGLDSDYWDMCFSSAEAWEMHVIDYIGEIGQDDLEAHFCPVRREGDTQAPIQQEILF